MYSEETDGELRTENAPSYFSPRELALELKLLLKDYYDAKFYLQGNKVRMIFPDGTKYTYTIS